MGMYNRHHDFLCDTQDKYSSVYIWRHIHILVHTGITVVTPLLIRGFRISRSCSVLTEKNIFVYMPAQICSGKYLLTSHKASWLHSTFCRRCCKKKKKSKQKETFTWNLTRNSQRVSPFFSYLGGEQVISSVLIWNLFFLNN